MDSVIQNESCNQKYAATIASALFSYICSFYNNK